MSLALACVLLYELMIHDLINMRFLKALWPCSAEAALSCAPLSLLIILCFGRVPPFSQSGRETKAASHILQTVWAYKDLRNTLYKAGWNKSHFKVHKRLFSF